MRVYLDACCLQRPLDDRSQPRVNIEAEAVLTILRLVENGGLELISSDALEFEVERTPDSQRRGAAKEILKLASETIRLDDNIETDAGAFVESGFKPLDALHLAFASHAEVEYLCTCDDKFRKKAKRVKSLKVAVVAPLEFVEKVVP
jgi:predicted nucleic acid-binding protein